MDTTSKILTSAQMKRLLALAITESKSHLPAGFDNRQEWVRHLAPSCGGDEEAAAALVRQVGDPKAHLALQRRIKSMAETFKAKAASPQQVAATTLLDQAALAALVAWHHQALEEPTQGLMLQVFEDLAVFFAGDPLESMFEIAAQRLGSEVIAHAVPGITD